MNSLRARLLVIIGSSLVVLWSLVAAWMMIGLRGELRTALDDRLAASARMVAGLATQFAAPGAGASPAASAMMDVVARDGLACEVSLLRGELSLHKVARTEGSPSLEGVGPGYGTHMYGGKLWRTYVLDQGGIRVATADRMDVREGLLRGVALTAAVPFTVALVGSLVMLWIGIGGGLAPLERIRHVLAARKPSDDAPMPVMRVPRELEPLVGTIGQLLERVRSTLARERRFTDDAAHELRTPLTAVKTHLQVLRLAMRDYAASRDALDALDHADEGVLRMQRTMEQLLMLARLDGEVRVENAESCDAAQAAAQAAREAEAGGAMGGRVVLRGAREDVPVAMPEAMVVSALRNLLDNALRLSPQGSPVVLQSEPGEEEVVISVLDEGPGLSEAECVLAMRRFWRGSRNTPGSGLGLSITSTIAEHHGGTLSLRPRKPHGLEAVLRLPMLHRSA